MLVLWITPVIALFAVAGVVGACAAWLEDERRRLGGAAERVHTAALGLAEREAAARSRGGPRHQ